MSFNVARFLPQSASAKPDDCALKIPLGWEGEQIQYRSLSFSELETLSNRCANLLRAKGIEEGMRVQLAVRPGLELILITFALFKLGAVPVVIDPGMGVKSFLACVKRTQPTALIGIPLAMGLCRIFWNSFRSVKIRLKVGSRFEKSLMRASEDAVLVATQPDDLAAILFTSGSTGAPKGVLYEHGMFDAQIRLIGKTYGIERGEIDLPMLPVFALFNPAFGMTTVVPEMDPSRPASVDPKNIVQAILQNKVTSSFGSPVLWTKICRYCEEHSITLPTIKRVLMAGAPVSPSLIDAFKKVIVNGEIHTPYGATESLPVSSISGKRILEETMQKTNHGAGTCVGKLVDEVEAKVIAIHEGPIISLASVDELPIGEVGEILVKGPVVTKAYDQLKEATLAAKIFDRDQVWHRMGDTGHLDADGNLWFCGRVVERVRSAEGVLFTDPVEAFFNQQDGVFRSALIGLGDSGKQIPAIVIEPEVGQWPESRAAQSAWSRQLIEAVPKDSPASKIKQVFFKKAFPVDVRHNAKIHRFVLKKEFEKGM